jgi:hypothetical protein
MSQIQTLKPVVLKNFLLSLTNRSVFIDEVNRILSHNPTQPFYVNITPKPKNRSLSANAQLHVFYKQISKFTDTDLKTVGGECKIDFGLPIILADKEIGPVIGHALQSARFFTMTREQQVVFIGVIQISSLMNTQQHNWYRDTIIFYLKNNGLPLQYLDKDQAA